MFSKITNIFLFIVCFILCSGFTWNQEPIVCHYTPDGRLNYYPDENNLSVNYLKVYQLTINISKGSDKINLTIKYPSTGFTGQYNYDYNENYNIYFERIRQTFGKDVYNYQLAKDVFEYIDDNKKCPDDLRISDFPYENSHTITIDANTGIFNGTQGDCTIANGGCIFKLYKEDDNNDNKHKPIIVTAKNDNIECGNPKATECYHYKKENVPSFNGSKHNIYFEIGTTSEGRYLGVSYDSNYIGMTEPIGGFITDNEKKYIFEIHYGDNTHAAVENFYNTLSSSDSVSSLKLKCVINDSNGLYGYWAFLISKDGNDDYSVCTNSGGADNPYEYNLNYNSLCSNSGIKSAVKVVGYILLVIKWIAPLLIIVLGMVEFGKAVVSSDEKEIFKTAKSLILKIVSGVAIFITPTLIIVILNVIQVTKGIENDSNFGACTKCILDPLNSCLTTNNSTGNSDSTGGGGGNGLPDSGINKNSNYEYLH